MHGNGQLETTQVWLEFILGLALAPTGVRLRSDSWFSDNLFSFLVFSIFGLLTNALKIIGRFSQKCGANRVPLCTFFVKGGTLANQCFVVPPESREPAEDAPAEEPPEEPPE